MKKKKIVMIVIAVIILVSVVACIIINSQYTNMPAVIGKSSSEATQSLEREGITYTIEYDYNDDYKKDVVFGQSIDSGKRIEKKTEATLQISKGKKVVVPDIVGESKDEMMDTLTDIKYKLIEEYNDKYKKGVVYDTSPVAGEILSDDQELTIYISKGKLIKVPDITGMVKENALKKLKKSGIEVGTVSLKDVTDKKSDIVLSYTPSSVEEGGKVDIEVSRECIDIPDLRYYSIEEAQDKLASMGLKSDVSYTYPNISDVQCNGVSNSICVIAQDKTGMEDKKTSKVNLSVQMPAIEIDNVDFEMDSAGGVDVKLAFTNKSGNQIAYITFTVKFYDTMGYPADCEVTDKNVAKLKYTGPLNGWSSSGWCIWRNAIYNSAFGAFQPVSAEIQFTDGSTQTLNYDGRYWYNDKYYGGDIHDE